MNRLHEVIDELKALYPNYEERKEQMDMWEAVYRSMKNGEKIAIHAPTGTGKSLGYVIPAIAMKLDHPKFKMTLSTYTLNLQEQLVKDVELGIQIYNTLVKKKKWKAKPLSFVALKGKKNYFCKRRLLEIAPGAIPDKKLELMTSRMEETTVWDRQNMNLDVSYQEWEQVQVEGCTKRQCPFHSHCTYHRSHTDINQYDFVITNHSLWFTRFYYVEPWEEFDFFVFDEAHKLEKTLLETYTFDLSMRKFESWIDQGAKIALQFQASESDVEDWRHEMLYDHETIQQAKQYLERLGASTMDPSITLAKMKANEQEAKTFVLQLIGWQREFYNTFLSRFVSSELKADEAFMEEQKAWVKNLLDLKEFAMLSNHKQNVGLLWLEKGAKEQVTLKVTPNNISHIHSPFTKGSLVTSGTLAENRSCASFAHRMKFEMNTDLVLNSPFPLHEQTIVYVSKDTSPKKADYEDLLDEEIMQLIQAGKQKTFVLFTSNKLMRTMYKRLHNRLREMETYNGQTLDLWIQDKNNHKQVVASFLNEEVRSVLFGTLSYFEGIDLKGDSLSQIILSRLPYSVPTHPIQEVLDADYGYSQWEAVVRYEQAFGRLIRTGYDYGSFCILDNRISYLRQFADMFEAEHIPMVSDVEAVKDFYKSHK